jgi:hypothetical protein
MVYHSVPDPNKTYPDHMENHEIARFEIQKVFCTADKSLIDHVETIVTIYQIMEIAYTRDQMISQMRQQGNHFYFHNKKLHLDWVSMTPFIHLEKSTELRDILE